MMPENLKNNLDRNYVKSKRKSAVYNALAYALCAALLLVAVPMMFSSSTAADGCLHTCDDTCGFVEAVPCDHNHNDDCGYAEAKPCGYVHTHDDSCGYDDETGDGCTDTHTCNSSCGFVEASACAHKCDGESCGFVAAAPCGHDCDVVCVDDIGDAGDTGLIEDSNNNEATDGNNNDNLINNNGSTGSSPGGANSSTKQQDLISKDTKPSELWFGDALPLSIIGLFDDIIILRVASIDSIVQDGSVFEGEGGNVDFIITTTDVDTDTYAASLLFSITGVSIPTDSEDILITNFDGTGLGTLTLNVLPDVSADIYEILVLELDLSGDGTTVISSEFTLTVSNPKVTDTQLTIIPTLPASVPFTNLPQPVSVTGVTGVGDTITVSYEGTSGTSYTKSTTAPTDAGIYAVTVTINNGTGFTGVTDLSLGNLTISESLTSTVTVNTQIGTMTARTSGTSVTFPVSVINIAPGTYDFTTNVANLPTGITVGGSIVVAADGSGTGTLTLYGDNTTNAGSYTTLTLTINGTTSAAFTLAISMANQPALTVNDPGAITYGQASTVILDTSGGGGTGAVTFSLVSGTAATVNATSGELTILGAGTIVVNATKAADSNFNAATSVDRTITIGRAAQGTLTVNTVADQTFATPNPMVTLSTTGGTGTGGVTYNVVSGPGQISGDTLTITGAGTISVTATKAADTNYNATTSAPISITVNRAPIASAAISVTAPVLGAAPSGIATISGGTGFTAGAVTWSGGSTTSFEAETAYTATVTLTAGANYTFTGFPATGGTINANIATASSITITTVTLTWTFGPTDSADVPSAPRSFTATAGDGQVELSWIAPLNNGGAIIEKYQVSMNNGTTWVDAATMTGHTFTGLTNDTEYTFLVRAVNDAGNGDEASVTATPTLPAPEYPTIPGNEGEVDIPYTEEDGTVSLIIDDDVLNELIDTATDDIVSINIGGVAGATSVVISTEILEEIVDAGFGISVTLPQGTITLDPVAAAALADQANGTFTLSLYQPNVDSLTAAQQETFNPGDTVFSITAYSDGQPITSFGGGVLTITVPYSGPLPAAVWYMDASGNLTSVPSTYSAGYITFSTTHLSVYLIRQATQRPGTDNIQDEKTGPQTGDYSNTTLWSIMLLSSMFGILLTIIWKKYQNEKHKWDRLIKEHGKK